MPGKRILYFRHGSEALATLRQTVTQRGARRGEFPTGLRACAKGATQHAMTFAKVFVRARTGNAFTKKDSFGSAPISEAHPPPAGTVMQSGSLALTKLAAWNGGALPFGRLWYGEPDAVSKAIG